MEFKVLLIKDTSRIKKTIATVQEDDEIKKYDFIDNFHCFKILNDHYIVEKGIEKVDNEIVNSMEFLQSHEGRRLVSIGYIFINTFNGNVYIFNCSTKKINSLFLKYFALKDADTKVDPDKLSKITEIEVKLTGSPQISLLHENIPINNFDLTKELEMQDQPIEKFSAKYSFGKQGAVFAKSALKKVMSKYEFLYIDGLDDHDNIIKIRDSVQLIISIDLPFSNFKELDNISFNQIILLLLDKERGVLNGY